MKLNKGFAILSIFIFFTGFSLFAQDVSVSENNSNSESSMEDLEDSVDLESEYEAESEESSSDEPYEYKIGEIVIPAAKRPRKPDSDDILAMEAKNEKNATDEYVQNCYDTFLYGLEEEISTLMDELTTSEDLRFVDPIYDLFYATKNPSLRQKIMSYFTKLKDPCLEDYAVEVLSDPYDQKKDTVSACFAYVSAVECKAAIPCIVTLLDKEEEAYFNGALSTLGDIAGKEEAMYLASYLDRDDLTVAQRQSLMKVLGKIQAIETYNKLSEIAQDEDENSYVRMYAAEAIGAMGKSEAEDILIRLFEESDPNFRVYVLKGISHYNDKKADDLILQGLRDGQWKVRLEAVNTVSSREMKEAVPFLIYRCKDTKEEKNVKTKCYKVIAQLNTEKGNEYLVSILKDKKIADATKGTVAAALLEYNNAGTEEILALADESLKDDKMKNLRYTLGKEFAKYGRPEFESICEKYIQHKDVATQGTGLDIFAKGKYESVWPLVEALAAECDEETNNAASSTGTSESSSSTTTSSSTAKTAPKKKVNANAKKAKRILQRLNSLGENKTETSSSAEATDATAEATESTASSEENKTAEESSETSPAVPEK